MNPFDWHGPAFLGFYLLLTLAVLAGIYYLRDGPAGAISVAMVSLLEHGHLTTNDGMLTSVAAKETRLPKLERTIVDYFQAQGWPKAAIADEELRLATVEQAQSLAEKGLLPDRRHRTQLTWAALGILTSVAVLKLMLAGSRGRQNVGFLIMLWLVAVVVTVVLMFSSEQSEGGKSALAALRELFGSRFQQSLSILPRSDLNEFIMLAAIFGVADVPSRALGPPVAAPGSASGGCGGSSCGGGGGSCGGGGGCGGGGCGGCGS